jgi:Cdc6-like AAA superfamily ATPase
MAEALGLLSAVFTLVDLSSKLVSKSSSFLSRLRKAPANCRLLLAEVSSTSELLIRLLSLVCIKNRSSYGAVVIFASHGSLERCEELLVKIKQSLEDFEDRHFGVLDRVRFTAEHEKKIKEWIRELKEIQGTLQNALNIDTAESVVGIREKVNEMHEILMENDRRNLENERQNLLAWIAPLNIKYQDSFDTALEKQFPGTGTWLLECENYRQWVTNGGCLCVHGFAGAGKTVLSAVVIGDLLERSKKEQFCLLYYYFNFQDSNKTKLSGLYDSLIRQLLAQKPTGYQSVQRLCERTNIGHPTEKDLVRLIEELLTQAGTVYLAIDGADEFECSEFGGLVRVLEDIKSHGATRIRIFLTSRDATPLRGLYDIEIRVSEDKNKEDIKIYAQGRLDQMSAKRVMSHDLQSRLINRVVENASGL